MVDAHDRRTMLAALGLAIVAGAWPPGALAVTPADDRARAEWLASSYARHVGAGDRGLDQAGEIALGESGLHYDAAHRVLIGRVFVQRAQLAGASPAGQANLRRMVGALNDPRIGGLYDRAGATFVLDEERDGYFLERAFPVAETSPDTLAAAMDRMILVSARWVTTWIYEVAMVMHGHRLPPTHSVTLEDHGR